MSPSPAQPPPSGPNPSLTGPSWPSRGHIPSLDGLRAVSIFVVFVGHCLHAYGINGGGGVTVFFFISGYLITTLMLRERLRTGRLALRAFWMRRVLRLGPPLILALALSVGLATAGLVTARLAPFTADLPAAMDADVVSLDTLAAQVFFYFNYYFVGLMAEPIAGTGVLWSLSVEEHFYLLWPLVFPLLAAPLVAGRLAWAPWIVLALVAFPLWRLYRFHVWGDSETVIYFLSDTRMDSLLYGCALSLCQFAGLVPRVRWPLAWLVIGTGLFLWRMPPDLVVARYSLQGLGLMVLFHVAVTRPEHWAIRPLNWAPVARIGVWSYSFYLVHYVIIFALEPLMLAPDHGPWAVLPLGLAAGALGLAWSAGVHAWVEQPMARLRQRLYG